MGTVKGGWLMDERGKTLATFDADPSGEYVLSWQSDGTWTLAEAMELRRTGKLEQECPSCGLKEAAGPYCTACVTPTGIADWRRHEVSEASMAALERLHAGLQTAPDER
jgi:hypothetical protein